MTSWNARLLDVLEKSLVEDMGRIVERDANAAVNYGKRMIIYKKSLVTMQQLSEIDKIKDR